MFQKEKVRRTEPLLSEILEMFVVVAVCLQLTCVMRYKIQINTCIFFILGVVLI